MPDTIIFEGRSNVSNFFLKRYYAIIQITQHNQNYNHFDFRKKLKGGWFDYGVDTINSLDPETATRVVSFLLTYVMTEVKVGLGLMDTDDDPGELMGCLTKGT